MRALAPLALFVLAVACTRPAAVDAVAEPAPTAAADAAPSASAGAAARPAPDPEPAAAEEPDPYPWPPGYTPPAVWETRKVVVDGVTETWSLRWRKPPRWNGCFPWSWCDCSHLEWGLRGQLELVRARPGEPEESLDLAALREGGEAQIPGFLQLPADMDHTASESPLRDRVVKRPRAVTMKLGDYDHDGRATEFVFQIGYLACGQQPSVLVGISKADPHLHVFGTAEEPGHRLVMTYVGEWEAIRKATGPRVEVPLHLCGDHGGGGYYLTLRFDAAHGFHVEEAGPWACDWSTMPPRRTVRRAEGEE